MAIFQLSISTRTAKFGDNVNQERNAVADLLRQAAQQIGSNAQPFSANNVEEPGHINPTNCQWSFGAGSLSAPVNPASGTIAGGTAVTIKGSGFSALGGNGAVNGVTFGGAPATSFVLVDDATITCVTPARAAGVVDVVPQNRSALQNSFTYV